MNNQEVTVITYYRVTAEDEHNNSSFSVILTSTDKILHPDTDQELAQRVRELWNQYTVDLLEGLSGLTIKPTGVFETWNDGGMIETYKLESSKKTYRSRSVDYQLYIGNTRAPREVKHWQEAA